MATRPARRARAAAAHTLTAGAGRTRNNLTRDLSERIEMTLSQEILSLTARIPTVEHFERTAYLDRLHLLRKGFPELAAFCWVLMEAFASVVSLGLSVWLLWSVHPVLSLLAACALPWMWLSRRAQRRLHEARQESARTARLELRLHELCLTPDAATEIRVAGSGPELGHRADVLWQDMTRRETAARWYDLGAELRLAAVLLRPHRRAGGRRPPGGTGARRCG